VSDESLVLSVVSHGQRSILLDLLDDLTDNVRTPFRLILTENIPEEPDLPVSRYPFPIEVVKNLKRRGFGANHNAALGRSRGELFCVLNPDIRIPSDPFPLLGAIAASPLVGVVAPVVRAPDNSVEDHARRFPSIFTLLAKVFGHRPRMVPTEGQSDYRVDWIAGMFMLFRSDTLRSVGGFDERYFLYYEDVDLCARLHERGLGVAVNTAVSVTHHARRESRRNLKYAWWHLGSAARFLASHPRIALGLR